MVLESNLLFLSGAGADFPGMRDGVTLLKVWLHQRELDKVAWSGVWAGLAWPAQLPLSSNACVWSGPFYSRMGREVHCHQPTLPFTEGGAPA